MPNSPWGKCSPMAGADTMGKNNVIFVAAGQCAFAPDRHLGKLSKKYTLFTNYAGGPAAVNALEGATSVEPAGLAAWNESDATLAVVRLIPETFDAGMAAVTGICDRHTFLVVSAANALVFAGLAANKNEPAQKRACAPDDVVATLCYMFGFPVPADCTGAVLYQGLKDRDFPHTEIRKLRDINVHLEAAIERDSRAPWDKHDCA